MRVLQLEVLSLEDLSLGFLHLVPFVHHPMSGVGVCLVPEDFVH